MKRIIQFAINQPLFIILGALLFILAGVYSFKTLSVEAFPDVTDTQVTVIALPGAGGGRSGETSHAAHRNRAGGAAQFDTPVFSHAVWFVVHRDHL